MIACLLVHLEADVGGEGVRVREGGGHHAVLHDAVQGGRVQHDHGVVGGALNRFNEIDFSCKLTHVTLN